jgi:hypothetical protein
MLTKGIGIRAIRHSVIKSVMAKENPNFKVSTHTAVE